MPTYRLVSINDLVTDFAAAPRRVAVTLQPLTGPGIAAGAAATGVGMPLMGNGAPAATAAFVIPNLAPADVAGLVAGDEVTLGTPLQKVSGGAT